MHLFHVNVHRTVYGDSFYLPRDSDVHIANGSIIQDGSFQMDAENHIQLGRDVQALYVNFDGPASQVTKIHLQNVANYSSWGTITVQACSRYTPGQDVDVDSTVHNVNSNGPRT